MEDMWNLRACLNRSSGQPCPAPSTVNQFDMNPGQLSQPYVAQEVCVIERTIRQEPVGPNLMNFGHQGLSPNKLRSELLAMVSGVQQHRPSYQPLITSRSTYIASHPQFSHVNPANSAGLGGWPSMIAPNLLPTNRVGGSGSPNPGADACQSGQGRDLCGMTGGRIGSSTQENTGSTGMRTSGTGPLKQSMGFSSSPNDQGGDGNRQGPSPQWLTDIVSQRQRMQSVHGSPLVSVNSDSQRTEHCMPDMRSGGSNQSQSAEGVAPTGRPRIYCLNYAGMSLGGELCLTDAGRLGVICSCHGLHMSVTKFTHHAGMFILNPGEAVFMEGGETLVQWRKMFFYQYGVKVPDDNVGWDWSDVDNLETGQPKYKAVMTQSWQKEDVLYNGNPSMVKSKMTQVWDASLANGSNPLLHATQSISNTKYASTNSGQGSLQDLRESLLQSSGRTYRGNAPTDYGPSQFYSDNLQQTYSRSQGNTGSSTPFQGSHLGDMPMSNEYFNFISDGGQRYISPGQQVSAAVRNAKGPNYPLNRWSDGQEPRLKEKDSSSSSFELRLGQPSQQAQPAGAPFSPMPPPTVEHHKPRLFEQVMSRVWDIRTPQDVQQFNPAELPRFSGTPGQASEQRALSNSNQLGYERTGYVETRKADRSGDKNSSSLNGPPMQSARHNINASQSTSNPDPVAESIQANLPTLDCNPQSNKPNRSSASRVQCEQSGLDKMALKFVPHADQLRRSVTLENGTTLDSLSSGALVQLSNKTGHRLLETAIQSSFGYRAMGLETSSPKTNEFMYGKGVRESLSRELSGYGRPPFPSHLPIPNFAMGNDAQNEFMAAPQGGLDNIIAARVHHGSNGFVNMRDRGGQMMNHFPSPKFPVVEGTNLQEELRERRGPQLSLEGLQEWSRSMSANHWDVQEQQQVLRDKQTRVQGVPEADNNIQAGWGLKVKSSQVQSSEVGEGQGGSESSGAGHDELSPDVIPETTLMDVRSGDEQDPQGGPAIPTDSSEDFQCSCYKCRKSSPSTRGRAVPRLAGQVCLKEKGGSNAKVEPGKKKIRGDGFPKLLKKCNSPQKQRVKTSEPSTDLSSPTVGMGEKLIEDPSCQPLHWKDLGRVNKEPIEPLEDAAKTEPQVPRNEDHLSDTAAKGTQAGPGSSRVPKALSDICSKSSENVLSGLSDEGCDNEVEGKSAESLGKPVAIGVLDESSGIGKCSSSDGVDMGMAANPNPLSAVEDLNKRESPSSLGCPSSSERLIVKRNGPRATGEWHVSKEPEETEAEPEAIITATPGKLEKKRRRTMKWKRLDSDVGAGESKKGKTMTSSDQIGGPKDLVQKTDDQGGRGGILKVPAEKEPFLKRRRVSASSENPSAVTNAKEKEANEEKMKTQEADCDTVERKIGTLVIRVPQGVNRQKAKRAVRTNTISTSKVDVSEKRHPSPENTIEGPVIGKSTTKNFHLNRSSGSSSPSTPANTSLEPQKELPSKLTKNLRSVRTPLGGPSPRNGRMVSLSDIMKQPAQSRNRPEFKEGLKGASNLKAEVTRTRVEGKIQKKVDANVPVVALTLHTHNQLKERAFPEKEPPREEKKVRVLHKEEARKVRSLWELTGKNNLPGPGAEVFDFAEDAMDGSRACKEDASTVQSKNSTPLFERTCSFPRSGRSARSVLPNKRNVEWHRSKDAQVDPGKIEDEAMASENDPPPMKWKISTDGSRASAARTRVPRPDLCQNANFEVSHLRKQVRSNKLIVKRFHSIYKAPDVRLQDDDLSADVKATKNVQVKASVAEPRDSKSLFDRSDMIERSVKRLKLMGGFRKIKEKAAVVKEKPTASCKRALSPDKHVEKLVDDLPMSKIKLHTKIKSAFIKEEEKILDSKEKKTLGRSGCNTSGQRPPCDVCGTSASYSYNRLLSCGRCPVKVHQACYGVTKIPKGPWFCRTCKFSVNNPICVLCGYGGGAMTRVQKSRGFGQGLLQAWRELDEGGAKVPTVAQADDEDDEILLSVSNSLQLGGNDLSAGLNEKMSANSGTPGSHCESCSCSKPGRIGSLCNACMRENCTSANIAGAGAERPSSAGEHTSEKSPNEPWSSNNTITAIVNDAGAKQWAHMVCTLWMPGTRCLNMGTMGVFDVSGVAISRRKSLCSICQRKGGACIQCRVPKCSVPFHTWCAHQKGLLQSETVQDGTNQVGFFGKCQLHGNCSSIDLLDALDPELYTPASGQETCARVEGYKGRQSLEERAKSRQQMALQGSMSVTPEQVAAWLRINDRKTSTRRFIKPANSIMKYDHREYLRFKQKKGWRRLAVYKSGIHALGLYTTEFIAEGEVVVEYIGEIVGLRVADKREAEYHSGKRLQYQGACYLFRIDTEQIIDATRKGGIARFVNHSCSPNCVAKVICVDNLKKVFKAQGLILLMLVFKGERSNNFRDIIFKVIFFAKRDIYAGEEVTYDYKFNYDEVGDKIPCFCGSSDCRGTLN